MAAWLRLALAALLLAGLLAGAARARAAYPPAQASPVTLSVRAGFDSYYKDGRWVPLHLIVANDGPDVRGTLLVQVPRSSSGSQIRITRDIDLPNQSRREIFLYVPTEGYTSSLQVSLVEGKRTLDAKSVRLVQAGSGDLIYGVLAGSFSAYNVLANIHSGNGTAFVAQLEPGDLPPVGLAWHSLDVLVVSDVDTGVLTPEQRAALAGWVASGGRLIVAGGPAWQKSAAGLGDLLPFTPAGTQTLADLGPLAAFAAAGAPSGSAIVATGTPRADAQTLASAGGLPLVLARHSGFGQVVYLAADPAFAPLKGWDGVEGLFRGLMSDVSERPSWAAGLRNWYSARDAVNALPGLDFPSTLQICGFLGLYLVAVGPFNYFLLKRLKRRELAWLSIPLIVLLFSGAAYLSGYQLRGAKAVLHRLAVVQIWPDSAVARVDGAVGLFSPRRTDYDLAFADGFLARPMPVDNSGGGSSSFTVMQADHTQIPGVRMEVGGVEPFVIQGQMPAPQFESNLVLKVANNSVELAGTITNRSQVALSDAVVLAPGGALRLGDLAPGATANVSLPLVNSRATPASTSSILPAISSAGVPQPQPYYPPGTYDSTIDDILGTSNYYSDREEYRRYSLLSSVIDSYSGSVRGTGVYLVGWSGGSPIDMQVLNRSFSTVDSTLYFVSLPPALSLSDAVIAIPPGLMTWSSLSPSQTVAATPYDMYVYQGTEFVLGFRPAQIVSFGKVQGLTLHLTSYGVTGPTGLNVDLWDYAAGQWTAQPGLQWGDTPTTTPERYVSPSGDIQVRVTSPGQLQVSIERLDFTLYVER